MPGFLGTEKQFQARYGKPILQSRDAKSTSKEQEAGTVGLLLFNMRFCDHFLLSLHYVCPLEVLFCVLLI